MLLCFALWLPVAVVVVTAFLALEVSSAFVVTLCGTLHSLQVELAVAPAAVQFANFVWWVFALFAVLRRAYFVGVGLVGCSAFPLLR